MVAVPATGYYTGSLSALSFVLEDWSQFMDTYSSIPIILHRSKREEVNRVEIMLKLLVVVIEIKV